MAEGEVAGLGFGGRRGVVHHSCRADAVREIAMGSTSTGALFSRTKWPLPMNPIQEEGYRWHTLSVRRLRFAWSLLEPSAPLPFDFWALL